MKHEEEREVDWELVGQDLRAGEKKLRYVDECGRRVSARQLIENRKDRRDDEDDDLGSD